MKNKGFYRKLCAILSIVFLCSCNQIQQSFTDTFATKSSDTSSSQDRTTDKDLQTIPEQPNTPTTEDREKINFLSDSVALKNARLQLMELPKFKGKKVMFYSSIHFYDDGRVNLQLQDPAIPEYLDSYSFRDGKWEEPSPVRTNGRTLSERQLYSLSDLDFTAVSRIFNEMTAYAQRVEGAETVTHIYFLSGSNGGGWRASLSGSREGYSVTADLTGKQVKFERN